MNMQLCRRCEGKGYMILGKVAMKKIECPRCLGLGNEWINLDMGR